MTLKIGTMLGLIALGITLAYHVSSRLSTDALDIAVGVLCGIGASVPVSLGLLVALTRQHDPSGEDEPREDWHPAPAHSAPRSQTPQVIVIAPPHGSYEAGPVAVGYPPARSVSYPNYQLRQSDDAIEGRDWRIIGEDE